MSDEVEDGFRKRDDILFSSAKKYIYIGKSAQYL